MSKKFLEGLTQLSDGRYKLIETMTLDSSKYEKLKLTESTKIVETSDGISYPVRSVYEFKIWDNNFNLNGRNYGQVIDKVMREKAITLGFTNHPKDGEEDVNNYFAVEKNPHLKDGWLCVDIYFVGNAGKLAEDILEVGGPIAVSSSALGDLDNKGNVLAEGFELERYADWVWMGANNQQQFLDDTKKAENVQKENKPIKKEVTIYNEDKNSKENTVKEIGEKTMNDKIVEKSLILNIKGMVKDAMQEEDLNSRLGKLDEALSYTVDLSDNKIKEEITVKMEETKSAINDLAEKGKSVDSLEESLAKKDEELSKIKEELEDIKIKYEESVKVFEASQGKEKEVMEALDVSVNILKEEITKLEQEKEEIQAVANTMVEADEFMKLKRKNEMLERRIKTKKSEKVSTSKVENKRRSKEEIEKELKAKKLEKRREEIREEMRKKRHAVKKANNEIIEEESNFLNEKVELYYNDLLKINEAFEDVRSDFEKCKSIREAQKLVVLDEEEEDIASKYVMKENITKDKKVEEKVKKPSSNIEKYLKQKNFV